MDLSTVPLVPIPKPQGHYPISSQRYFLKCFSNLIIPFCKSLLRLPIIGTQSLFLPCPSKFCTMEEAFPVGLCFSLCQLHCPHCSWQARHVPFSEPLELQFSLPGTFSLMCQTLFHHLDLSWIASSLRQASLTTPLKASAALNIFLMALSCFPLKFCVYVIAICLLLEYKTHEYRDFSCSLL